MFDNPPHPVPRGAPDRFFGRRDLLSRFDLALSDEHSDHRALFITGTHGIGRTALLTQLGMRASEQRRRVIELGPQDSIAHLMHALVRSDDKPSGTSPHVGASLKEDGNGHGAGSVSKTTRCGRECFRQCSWPPASVLTTVF